MADSVRVVTFQSGGQITEVLALQSSLDWTINSSGFTRDSLAIMRGERNQQMVSRGGRYDGEDFGGEKVSNSTYKFQVLVGGPTPDALIAKMNELYSVTERIPGPLYIEHQDDGATYPSYYEIRAPAKAQDNRTWAQRMGAGSVAIDVEWPVAPLACGAPMDVTDTAVASNLTDYTFDAMTAGTFAATAALTSERRIIHTVRGYKFGSHQVTVSAAPGATISGYKLGAVVKRVGPDSYVEVYVDDNGVNSRLRIDTINAGTRTNRFTTNLAARVSNGTTLWVRGRIENSIVYAEYFTSAPPHFGSTPTTSGSYTLLTTDLALMGVNVQGQAGESWIPQHASATVPTFTLQPYAYRNRTLPDSWRLDGPIPGDAPALADVSYGTAASRVFGMVGWAPRSSLTAGLSIFKEYEAESAALTGWTATADAACRGGNVAQATAAGAVSLGNYAAVFPLATDGFVPDADTPGQMTVEVWAAVNLASSLVLPTMRATLINPGNNWSYSLEYGSAGKVLAVPSSGTRRRFVRLGTLIVDQSAVEAGASIQIAAGCAALSAGAFGLDYVKLIPASRRALSPTGKAFSSTGYPYFCLSSVVRVKSSLLLMGGGTEGLLGRAGGVGGSPIALDPGPLDVMTHVSDLIPDNPTSSTETETATTSMSIRFSIVPRFLHQRSE